ncbi:MAG: helix-hairpin-helix domain-containing protein [Bacteroidota bacterium]
MNNFKSHFRYNKRQRNGILFLAIIILILQLIYFFFDFSYDKTIETNTAEIKSFQAQVDSLKKIEQQKKSNYKIYPFNPNYLTDFKAYQLGLNVKEIDKLFTYRNSGKFVNSAKEFQKITGINDSLLSVISPYFKFPEWVKNQPQRKTEKENFVKKDLNKATENELQNINGIGEKLAKRIIAYRVLLQGYSFDEQLYEVYYLDKAVADKVLEQFTVIELPKIEKLNLNNAKFKEVLHLPYIDYKLTKRIVNYRDKNGAFGSVEELKKIDSFPLDKFDRIALYLTAE